MRETVGALEFVRSRVPITRRFHRVVLFVVLAQVLVGWLPIHERLIAQVSNASAAPSSGADQEPEQSDTTEKSARPKGRAQRSFGDEEPVDTSLTAQLQSLRHALIRLPIAAGLSAILAFRPRRRGTPERQSTVIQTQIILAIVGAIVMLVVGASLARAFGIVGAAGLIRYRAKIENPKDAGVMLSTLALGLASGVGLYLLAAFATAFVVGVLWVVESLEPEPHALFDLKIAMKDPANAKASVEAVLRRFQIPFDLRGNSPEEIRYEVKVPVNRKTETVSEAMVALDPKQAIEVTWERKKEKP